MNRDSGTSSPGGASGAVTVTVRLASTKPHGVDAPWLAEHLDRALSQIEHPVLRVGVLVVDDARMTELHRRYLGLDETTDVLTFPNSEPGAPVDVDIAVCADVARREGAHRGTPITTELLLYAVHGVLHCCGFDDRDPIAFAAMHAEEDRILRAIGVGVTYAADTTEAAGDPNDAPEETQP